MIVSQCKSYLYKAEINLHQAKLLFCIFIDNKTTDGDLVSSRQHGAVLLGPLVTPSVRWMVLQFSIYRTKVWRRERRKTYIHKSNLQIFIRKRHN